MDVWGVFVGDSTLLFGGSVRNTYYRDYEQFPYGTLEQSTSQNSKDPFTKVQVKRQQIKSEKVLNKDCPFCKEHKKRPLVNYLRKRDSRKHHESICEDEEVLEDLENDEEIYEFKNPSHVYHKEHPDKKFK